MAESQGVNKRLLKTVQARETLVFPPLILLILILSQCQTKKSSWQTTDSHDEESSEIFKGKTLKTAIIIKKLGYFLVCAENSLIIFFLSASVRSSNHISDANAGSKCQTEEESTVTV